MPHPGPATSIHVVGAAFGTGRWLVDRVFTPAARAGRVRVFCYDINTKALDTLDASVVRCPLDPPSDDHAPYAAYAEQFQEGDWVFVATPAPAFESAAGQVMAVVRPGSLVVTMASVQVPPIGVLDRIVPAGVTYCGCHLLFGVDVSSPVGQFAVLTAYQEGHPRHAALRQMLSDAGLLVSALDAAEHDRQMAYVQALTHFCLLGFVATLTGDGARPRELFKQQTPNFQFLYAFASRVMKLAPTTTGSIQSAPDAAAVRKNMLETLTRMHRAFDSAPTVQAAADVVTALLAPISEPEIEDGAAIAVSAVNDLQLFHNTLHAYRVDGRPLVFRYSVTGDFKILRVVEIAYDEIIGQAVGVVVRRDGATHFAVATDDTARANYEAAGIRMPRPTRTAIKKRNISLLSAKELEEFFRTRLLPITFDLTVANPRDLDAAQFESGLPQVVAGLRRCVVRSRFRPPAGAEKVTLRIDFDASLTREAVTRRVRSVVEDGQIIPRDL